VTFVELLRRFFSLASMGKPVIGHSVTGPLVCFLLGGILLPLFLPRGWGRGAFESLLLLRLER
jgi:hypothetical protein